LNFTVGEGKNTQFLFSSGQRRAAGLAFLLAIHLSRPWSNLKCLLLDDPIQHIDDYRALNLIEVLSAIRRMGRQVIIAVEDPALADLLCRRLRSSVDEIGRRFDLAMNRNGSASIAESRDILPLPDKALELADVS
jgi:chromosome segregation protein